MLVHTRTRTHWFTYVRVGICASNMRVCACIYILVTWTLFRAVELLLNGQGEEATDSMGRSCNTRTGTRTPYTRTRTRTHIPLDLRHFPSDISEQTSVVNNTTGGQNPTVTSTTASITSTSVPEPTAEEREATAKREEQERLKREVRIVGICECGPFALWSE